MDRLTDLQTGRDRTVSRFDGPLYVDLDGTLIATDLLHESALQLAKVDWPSLIKLPGWLAQGKATLKQEIALRTQIDADILPYRAEVLDLVRVARAAGRRVVLATASDDRLARQVAAHLGLFDGVIASQGGINRSGSFKLEAIVADAGGAGAPFTYAGNSDADLPIWRQAAAAVVVGATPGLLGRVRALTHVEQTLAPATPRWPQIATELRLHQWLKNLLLALPLMPALGSLHAPMLMALAYAFVSFGMMASAIYIINDLLDLEADRRHARKRERPLASGRLSIPIGLATSAALGIASLALAAATLPWGFTACLLLYAALTSAYSMTLKRRAIVDVVVLAGLYTLRIIAGAMALELPVTLWILSFSMFLFLSLALAKRYVEIAMAQAGEPTALDARGYLATDLQFVMAAGIGAGQIAILVLNLYLNDASQVQHYRHPEILWLLGPMLLFWVLRVWFAAIRRTLHDDPVVFAVRDRTSQVILLASMALVVASL